MLRMWFIFRMSMGMPPRCGTEPPHHPVPPPRGVICSRLSSLSLTTPHLFGRLREGHEVGIQAPLQERDLREGREVVAVHHALEFRARNALRPEGVHESAIRIIEARHAAFSGGTRADKPSVGIKVTRLYGGTRPVLRRSAP